MDFLFSAHHYTKSTSFTKHAWKDIQSTSLVANKILLILKTMIIITIINILIYSLGENNTVNKMPKK